MKNLYNLILACLVLLCLISCRKTYQAGAYVKAVEQKDNGLRQEMVIEEKGIRFETQFRPPLYSALKEMGTENFDDEELQKLKKDYEQTIWFEFKIAAKDNDYDVLKGSLTPSEYTERLKYLSGAAKQDFSLRLNEGDTLPCAFYHFERTYNMTPYNTLLLGFDRALADKSGLALKKDIELIYNDKLFEAGRISFSIDHSQIKNFTEVNIDHL